MPEGQEGPIAQPEMKKPNRVVEAARGAVRKVLESDDAYKDWRNSVSVKDASRKDAYHNWAEASKKVVSAMTEVDQKKLSTRLYELRMKIKGVGEAVTDFTFNVLSFLPRKGLLFGGVLLGPFGIPAMGAGITLEGMNKGGFTKSGIRSEIHARKKIEQYQRKEAKVLSVEGQKKVNEKVKQILEGFAYPEGKPQKPPVPVKA